MPTTSTRVSCKQPVDFCGSEFPEDPSHSERAIKDEMNLHRSEMQDLYQIPSDVVAAKRPSLDDVPLRFVDAEATLE